jgi:hypothetical protein
MPFYGITIHMYWREHAPPHFHIVHAETRASMAITTREVIDGHLSRRDLALVTAWAIIHREALLENWWLCARREHPKKIPPLA